VHAEQAWVIDVTVPHVVAHEACAPIQELLSLFRLFCPGSLSFGLYDRLG